MLSLTEVLRQKINSFFLGFRTFSQSLIIASDLEESDFRSIWKEEKESFIREHPAFLKNYNEIEYHSKISAKSIYDFLYKNNSATIFFSPDDAVKILKSASCIKVIEGAICSSPDSGAKWSVSYQNQKAFRFNGYIIMHIEIGSIKWNLSKYHYLLRDVVTTDLDILAARFNDAKESIIK